MAMVGPDLVALFSLDPGRTDALEGFVASCLSEAGIWESSRTSDGIGAIERIVEHGPDALRVSGEIHEIGQSPHLFWLEVTRETAGDRFTWLLYVDVADASARRARNALTSHDRPEDITWRVTLAGEAIVQDDALAVVPGSTRALVRDAPALESPHARRRRAR